MNRRTVEERRGGQRRMVVDRRFATERRSSSGTWVAAEPPTEHLRNAMQLLMGAVESQIPMTPAEFARVTESALARLSLALSALEDNRR